jgi:hypothetical protein
MGRRLRVHAVQIDQGARRQPHARAQRGHVAIDEEANLRVDEFES